MQMGKNRAQRNVDHNLNSKFEDKEVSNYG